MLYYQAIRNIKVHLPYPRTIYEGSLITREEAKKEYGLSDKRLSNHFHVIEVDEKYVGTNCLGRFFKLFY